MVVLALLGDCGGTRTDLTAVWVLSFSLNFLTSTFSSAGKSCLRFKLEDMVEGVE